MCRSLSQAGRHAEGVELAERAVAADRDRLSLKFTLALAHWRAGDGEKMQAVLAEILEVEPDHVAANRLLGQLAGDRGDFEEAIRRFRKVTASPMAVNQDWFDLGYSLIELHRPAEAVEPLRVAVARGPAAPFNHLDLGLALMWSGAFDEALPVLTRAHELGQQRPHWDRPSQQWIDDCRRFAAGMAELERILLGERAPFATRDEARDALDACETAHLHGKAAELWRRMLEADPELLADEPRGQHLDAAVCALGAGTYTDDDHAAEPTAWRARARAWLELDLARLRADVEAGSRTATDVSTALEAWQNHEWLALVHDDAELARLPEPERAEWRAFWVNVQRTIDDPR